MAFRTICVTIAFTASAFVYYQLVINIGNMAGNVGHTFWIFPVSVQISSSSKFSRFSSTPFSWVWWRVPDAPSVSSWPTNWVGGGLTLDYSF